jgi:16S rRNA (cytosine967-C5)-methyltransferase
MSKWFRNNRKLGSRDRKIVAELAYTLIRYEEWFIRTGLLDGPIHEQSDLQPAIQWLHAPSELEVTQFDLKTHLSIPKSLADEWSRTIDTPKEFATHYQSRAPIDLRVNEHRTSVSKALRKLRQQEIACQSIANVPWGIRIAQPTNVQNLGLYKQGLVEIQDTASQLFLESVRERISGACTILDFCAGAGGKSLGLAAQGHTVFANEPRSNARDEIQKRALRAGLTIHDTLPNEPVDLVIVDAPCSGTGRLRREPTLRWRWRTELPSHWVTTQADILQQAQAYCKPDGLVIYATCSLAQAENDHTLTGYDAERFTIWGHLEACDGFSWTVFTPQGTSL